MKLVFAQQYADTPEKDLRIIKHGRQSLSYNDNKPWKKQNTESCFDLTMGSFDGAKFASFLASIHYFSCQINLINNLLVCIGVMDRYF